tara:strand:- start:3815 stop:5263 length:1449 start_codon:yes stop_codon:yes gene_type:complete
MAENTRTTLADISNSLSYLGEEQKTTSENLIAINKSFSNFFDREKEAAGDESETRRKGLLGRLFGRSPLSPVKAPEGTSAEKASGGGFLGKIFGTFGKLLSPLGALISMLMSPFTKLLGFLRPLLKLVVRGGPVGAAIALLYGIFKDIGDNENFKSTMDSIKTTWASVTERFDNIKTLVSDLFNSEGIQSGIEKITEWWQSFKDVMQGGLLGALDLSTKAIDGALFLIELTLKGQLPDWLYENFIGFTSFIKQKFKAGIDAAIDFLKDTAIDIKLSIIGTWTLIKFQVGDFFNRALDWVTSWIPDVGKIAENLGIKATAIYDEVTDFLTGFVNWFGGWLPDLSKIKAYLKDRFGNTRLFNYLFPEEEEQVAPTKPVLSPEGFRSLKVLSDIAGDDKRISKRELEKKENAVRFDKAIRVLQGEDMAISLEDLRNEITRSGSNSPGLGLQYNADARTITTINAPTTMVEQINSTHFIDLHGPSN